MTFPQTPLPTFAELYLGGAWVDVTSDVRATDGTSGIDIQRGITSSGGSVADRGTCTLTLSNEDGRYSMRNPRSPYYGQLRRNTPLRTGVLAGWCWLEVPYDTTVTASTPDNSALHLTGDLDLRADVELASWQDQIEVPLLGRWDGASNCSYTLSVTEGGIVLGWSPDGAASRAAFSTAQIPAAPAWGRICLRAALDVNNGSGGHSVTFYTAPSMAGPWTQLGDVASDLFHAGTTSVFAGTRPLEVGSISGFGADIPPATCRIYSVEVRNAGGTVVAAPAFSAQSAGTTSFTDSAGRAWTAPAGGITNRLERFVGEVGSWPLTWDTGGFDYTAPITANGILQRLGQGQPPLASALRRQMLADTTLRGYWPMEDAASATQGASALPVGAPLRLTGVTWAADTTLAGSGPLPQLAGAAQMSASPAGGPAGDWSVGLLVHPSSLPASFETFLTVAVAGGLAAQVQVLINITAVRVQAVSGDGTILGTADVVPSADFTADWSVLQVRTFTSGGFVGYYIETVDGSNFVNLSGAPGSPTAVTANWGADWTGMGIGHLVVGGPLTTPSMLAAQGNPGFDVPDRVYRTAGDAGIPVSVIGREADSETVGPEPQDTPLAVITDAAAADEGLLYEAREFVGLRYRSLRTLYNQPSALDLDYTADPQPLVAPLGPPTDDDQALRNTSTITRTNGSSATFTATEGPYTPAEVGIYPDTATLNLTSDDRVVQHAAWRVHVGTWDEARYPAVTIRLEKDPSLIEAVSRIDTGSRIRITGDLPSVLPPEPIDLLVLGYQETISQFSWQITFACVPYGPYVVGVWGGAVLPRADTAGCVLGADVTANATSLSLHSTATRWVDSSTYPAEFPFDIVIAGERITITAISGTTTTQTATVTRAVNGISKPQTAGTDVRLADPTYVAL